MGGRAARPGVRGLRAGGPAGNAAPARWGARPAPRRAPAAAAAPRSAGAAVRVSTRAVLRRRAPRPSVAARRPPAAASGRPRAVAKEDAPQGGYTKAFLGARYLTFLGILFGECRRRDPGPRGRHAYVGVGVSSGS